MKRSPDLLSESQTYQTWEAMKSRCQNPRNASFKYYGARGIKVCERWRTTYANFLNDMGERPTAQHSLDRINSDGDYEPGNCRWATTGEQADNKRSSKFIVYRGTRTTITQAIRIAGTSIARRPVVQRLKRGWTIEEAVETPLALRHERVRP